MSELNELSSYAWQVLMQLGTRNALTLPGRR
jgi:hypothetical protein